YSASSSTGGVIKNKELAKELFKAGYRQLSKKYHPDTGGTDGQISKELNNLKEQLDQLVK
ncbi:MAG TPA: molecular chaperone DnaJ, partial [Lachnospiraceae bacterium]|nr:molecular chaperone DnaJ [Lachnospiraceae bacterium]